MNLPNFDDRFLHYGYFIGTNSYDFKFEYENNYYSSKNKDIECIISEKMICKISYYYLYL